MGNGGSLIWEVKNLLKNVKNSETICNGTFG